MGQGITFLSKQGTITRLLETIDQEEDETKIRDNMLPDDQPGAADVGRGKRKRLAATL